MSNLYRQVDQICIDNNGNGWQPSWPHKIKLKTNPWKDPNWLLHKHVKDSHLKLIPLDLRPK